MQSEADKTKFIEELFSLNVLINSPEGVTNTTLVNLYKKTLHKSHMYGLNPEEAKQAACIKYKEFIQNRLSQLY